MMKTDKNIVVKYQFGNRD